MNLEIRGALINAILADIAYLDDLSPNDNVVDRTNKFKTRLTAPLAAYIAERFAVLYQSAESSSGFSVTVFRELSSNQLYVSLRGTEPEFADFSADLDLASLSGTAYQQIFDMVNWYLRARTPAGHDALQLAGAFLTLGRSGIRPGPVSLCGARRC
jgi:hypothetical protein